MDRQEKIQAFSDIVNAVQKMSEPWKKAAFFQLIVLVCSNAIWAALLIFVIRSAH